MIRLLVTGREGQIARALLERGAHHGGVAVTALGRPELDLSHPDRVAAVIAAERPDIIVNAAAYTSVDAAEAEPAAAFAINRDGARAVAVAAELLGNPVIQLSTDYVFSGAKTSPYLETDATGPLGIYGQSKLEGELAAAAACRRAIILRTSWVYSAFGRNFVKTMLDVARTEAVVRVVDDQTGNPTCALDVADALLAIAPLAVNQPDLAGTWHVTGTGAVTWCSLARHVFAVSRSLGGPSADVEAVTSADAPKPARRPANSRLDGTSFRAAFGLALPAWETSVETVVARILGA